MSHAVNKHTNRAQMKSRNKITTNRIPKKTIVRNRTES